jgi:ribosomal protein L37AE/L43A
MSINHDQTPAGGCTNCGGTVRTRKHGEWLCSACDRKIHGR